MAFAGTETAKAGSKKWREPSRLYDGAVTWKAAIYDYIVALAAILYQRTVVELILRQKHVEASKDGRHIPLTIDPDNALFDTRRGHSFISNSIRTSRYTVWDFIPKQLFFQFSRVGNFYFLCVGVPQMIPGLSTTGSYTTILPLLVFVAFTIAKEGYDDFRRYRLDQVENANFATVLGREDFYTGKLKKDSFFQRCNPFRIRTTARPRPVSDEEFEGIRWVPVRWHHVKVGDVIRLSRDEPLPADVVLLHSDGENGLAYIETMALDGETNLKSKQVSHVLKDCGTICGISSCAAEVVVEDPNPELFNFQGRVTVDDKAVPLTLNEVIYRGSVLRNTSTAIGLVINTGEECKIRMNSNQHPKAKRPALEKVVNRVVVTLAIYVVVLSVGVSMGYVLWHRSYEEHAWYLTNAAVPFYQIIIAFIIMFNNVIPLSLYVSLEIVKIGQLLMLNSDVQMYDEDSDTPARCNTNTILENLGQIGYIFSDKTGTLTENVMKFRKISVAGSVWLHQTDLEQEASEQSEAEKGLEEIVEISSTEPSVCKAEPVPVVISQKQRVSYEIPAFTPRPSLGRRSSSHWRSTGRPDHVQPDLTTSDMMDFVRLRPQTTFSKIAKEYLLAMALCHTCLPEERDGKSELQAASPDELALVTAAQEMGYRMLRRSPQSITLQVSEDSGEESVTFEILDVIEFSSARKRMSIVVKYPDGRICVICKGADSAILPRLSMSSLAMQKANEVKKSAELDREMVRRSEQLEFRNSFGGRPSFTARRNPRVSRERSRNRQPLPERSASFEMRDKAFRKSSDKPRLSVTTRGYSYDGRRSDQSLTTPVAHQPPLPDHIDFLDDLPDQDESDVFTNCFKHLDDFAVEGLRTLLYAQKFIKEEEYNSWKKTYLDATTSLVNRQDLIESAGDLIEHSFDLLGATAIEDKLQYGVPETIEKLRKANIKIWMLTGDKRETAINIAHSARLCQPGSEMYILDTAKGALDSQLASLSEDLQLEARHSVVVIDGRTLSVIEKSVELSRQFYSVMVRVDSVICCRASPAQKALLVRAVRSQLRRSTGNKRRGLTLAIGDGANDLAMISASHVGIGISGKEGLQAARVADYSIAQFRFLQRLLLVHGRWNYVRTAKFILATFWKEMFFYLPAAQYQRYNGYTGTSLYQSTSLTVYNTLFTSLCVICMGIWEQDLRAETLLAVPELYVYGQRNRGLNLWKYTRWMILAAIEGIITWYGVWAGYGWKNATVKDEGLYPLGTLAFTVGVLWINWKLFMFETHFKTTIVLGSFFLTTIGWFAWLCFLDGVYAPSPSGDYEIRSTFTQLWGRDAYWWATVFAVLAALGLFELTLKTAKRNLVVSGRWKWPPWNRRRSIENVEEWDLEIWQEMEQDPVVWERFKRLAQDGTLDDLDDEEVSDSVLDE